MAAAKDSKTQTLAPLPPITEAQQRVLDRIAMQRERLRARRAARAQSLALSDKKNSAGAASAAIDESLVLRTAAFAKDHPLAVAAMAGIALLAGPRRLVRWAGVVLPMLMRLRR